MILYRTVPIVDRLPPLGEWVTTIDQAGNHRVYRLIEHGWNMRDVGGTNSPPDNLPMTYWLEKVDFDGNAMIGEVGERFEQLKRYELEWSSFYDGWLEGRVSLCSQLMFSPTPNPTQAGSL